MERDPDLRLGRGDRRRARGVEPGAGRSGRDGAVGVDGAASTPARSRRTSSDRRGRGDRRRGGRDRASAIATGSSSTMRTTTHATRVSFSRIGDGRELADDAREERLGRDLARVVDADADVDRQRDRGGAGFERGNGRGR